MGQESEPSSLQAPGRAPWRSRPQQVDFEVLDGVLLTTSPSGPVAVSQSDDGRTLATPLRSGADTFELRPSGPTGRFIPYQGGVDPSVLIFHSEGQRLVWEIRDDGAVQSDFNLPQDAGLEGAVAGETAYMAREGGLVAVTKSGSERPISLFTNHPVRWVSAGHGRVLASSTEDQLEVFDEETDERWLYQDVALMLMVLFDPHTVVAHDIANEEMLVLDLGVDGFVTELQRSPWPRVGDRAMVPLNYATGAALVGVDLQGGYAVIQSLRKQPPGARR